MAYGANKNIDSIIGHDGNNDDQGKLDLISTNLILPTVF